MAKVSRPAQGNNSKPVKLGRPAYSAPFPAVKRVSRGSVSHPVPLPKWNPQATPARRRVSNPQTIV